MSLCYNMINMMPKKKDFLGKKAAKICQTLNKYLCVKTRRKLFYTSPMQTNELLAYESSGNYQ